MVFERRFATVTPNQQQKFNNENEEEDKIDRDVLVPGTTGDPRARFPLWD